MTAAQLKSVCEKMGFGIAHARRCPRSPEVRAYVAVRHEDHYDVDEFRWTPETPDGHVAAYQHATKPNGYGQYDKFLTYFTIADLL